MRHVAAVVVRALVTAAVEWVTVRALLLAQPDEVVGADIGAGLIAFVAVAVVSLIWSGIDAGSGWSITRSVVTWFVVGLLVGAFGAVAAQGFSDPIDGTVFRSDVVAMSPFTAALTTVSALIGAGILRWRRRP